MSAVCASISRRRSESGFALLFIYAMAATVAIMLYMELPRVAFEAQRDKEQLLIDRGEQYSRAITLYVRKFNRFPPDFDALDSTQNLRFLRGRYADPITGKNEWRLIHVGPGGVFLDSLVNKKKADDKQAAPQNFITEGQQVGGTQVDPAQGVNLANRVRPGDQAGAPGDPNNPQSPLPQTGQFPQPGQFQPGLPQVDPNGQFIPNPGPNVFGQQLNGQQPNGQQPNGQQPNGQQPPPIVPAGVNLINQLLTTPRPGGLNGLNGQQPAIDQYGNPVPPNPLNSNTPGNTPAPVVAPGAPVAPVAPAPPAAPVIGGGIAGVASKREQEGIKIYNEKKKYNEWEFVYDISKDKSRVVIPVAPPPAAAQQQQPAVATPQQQPQQIPPLTPPTSVMPLTPPPSQ